MAANKKPKEKKPREIIFSKEIDDRINGFAVVFMFIVGGFVLQYFPNHFGDAVVTSGIKWTCIIIGMLGLATEVGKIKGNIRGFDDIIWACLAVGIWIILHIFHDYWFVNILSFGVLLFGAYEVALGIQKITHSLLTVKVQPKEERKGNGDSLVLVTNLLGIVLVLIQLCKEIIDSNIFPSTR